MGWKTILLVIFFILLALVKACLERRLPKRFLSRGCMGREWRRRFPSASKQAIRRFLGIFLESFDLPIRHELRFSPDDKILDIYRDMYSGWACVDELELERFVMAVREEYGFDLGEGNNQAITLGEVFSAGALRGFKAP